MDESPFSRKVSVNERMPHCDIFARNTIEAAEMIAKLDGSENEDAVTRLLLSLLSLLPLLLQHHSLLLSLKLSLPLHNLKLLRIHRRLLLLALLLALLRIGLLSGLLASRCLLILLILLRRLLLLLLLLALLGLALLVVLLCVLLSVGLTLFIWICRARLWSHLLSRVLCLSTLLILRSRLSALVALLRVCVLHTNLCLRLRHLLILLLRLLLLLKTRQHLLLLQVRRKLDGLRVCHSLIVLLQLVYLLWTQILYSVLLHAIHIAACLHCLHSSRHQSMLMHQLRIGLH